MTATLSILSLESKKLKIGKYSMWFENNIIYCTDGTKTVQLDLNDMSIVPYDPTSDTALLPYETDNMSIAIKNQTIYNALYEQLGQIIQNEKDIAEIKLELPAYEYDPTENTANLPYNDNGNVGYKEQTVAQSILSALEAALSAAGTYDPTQNYADLPYIDRSIITGYYVGTKSQTVSESIENAMDYLVDTMEKAFQPGSDTFSLPYLTWSKTFHNWYLILHQDMTINDAMEDIYVNMIWDRQNLEWSISDDIDYASHKFKLPYDNNGTPGMKYQTVSESINNVLNTALQGGGESTYDPTVNTASLPYNNEGEIGGAVPVSPKGGSIFPTFPHALGKVPSVVEMETKD